MIRTSVHHRGPESGRQAQVKISMPARGSNEIAGTIAAVASTLGISFASFDSASYQLNGTSFVWNARKAAFDVYTNQWTLATPAISFDPQAASESIEQRMSELASGEKEARIAGYTKSDPAYFKTEMILISLFTRPGKADSIEPAEWRKVPDPYEFDRPAKPKTAKPRPAPKQKAPNAPPPVQATKRPPTWWVKRANGWKLVDSRGRFAKVTPTAKRNKPKA